MQNRENQLSTQPVGRLLWSLALPAITAQVVNVLYNMVDRMYIGHIPGEGAAALTGLGVTMPVIMLVSAFAALSSMGGAPRASIMMGRGKKEEAEKILGNCAAALVMMAVLLTVGILLFGRQALLLFGASADTIGYAWDYLSLYAMGTISVQLALGLNAFITAQGFSRISMLTVLIGAVCNIVLDPLFIFTFGMGVRGAALATILSQTVSAVWVLRFLTGKKTTLRIRLCNLRIQPKVYLPCMALGLSPFVMQFTESILSVSFNSSLLRYGGDLAVGSMTILSSVMQFSLLPLQGLSQGAQPIISYNFGAGNKERVRAAFRVLLISCLGYSTALWALAMLVPGMFASLFTSDAALIAAASHALRIYMGTTCLFGIQIACQQTFIAIGNAKTSLFLALLRKVFLLIPLIFILPLFLPNKVDAVLLAEPVSDLIAVTVTATLFFRAFRAYMNDGKNTKIEKSGFRKENPGYNQNEQRYHTFILKEEIQMAVNKVNSENFDLQVLQNTKPVLVDFYADWCGPCKMLAPVVEQIAAESDAYEVVKLNVDDAPDIAARYGVMSIPTLIVFKNGAVAGKTIGVQSKQSIVNMLG